MNAPTALDEFQAPEPAAPEPELWQTLSQTQRDALAVRLYEHVTESIRAQGEARRSRWLQIKKLHDVDESTVTMTFVEGMKPYVYPLLRQKCDRIVGAGYNGLTAIYPAVQVVDESDGVGGNVPDIERAIENVSKEAGRNKAIKQAIRTAFITNRSVWFIPPEVKGGKVTGITWKNLHPQNVAVFPAEVTDWEDAQTIGHRRHEQYWQVRQKMGAGEYFTEDSVKGGDDPNKHLNRESDTKAKGKLTQTPNEAAKPVEVWEVITWADLASLGVKTEDGTGEYKRYLCTFAYTSKKLLKIEPYPEGYPVWYIPVSLVEGCEDQAWPDDSVGQTVQQQQLAACDAITIIGQGSLATAGAPLFVAGGTLLDKKSERYEPFTIYYIEGEAKVFSFPSTFDPSKLFGFLELLEMNVDSLTGITRTGTGEQAPDRETATANLARSHAQAEAKDNYSDQVAGSLEKAAKLFFTYFTYHLDDLKKAYGSLIPIKDGSFQTDPGGPAPPIPGASELQKGSGVWNIPAPVRLRMMNPRFEVTGRSGSNTPMVVISKLQQALQLATLQGSEWDPLKIASAIMYALELPFSVDGLKKSPQQIQQEAAAAASQLHPGMLERLNITIKDLLPGEHAQFVQKYLAIQPDDQSMHPQSFGSQMTIMLAHAVKGLMDGSVSKETAMHLLQHFVESRNGGSSVPAQMKQEEKNAAAPEGD